MPSTSSAVVSLAYEIEIIQVCSYKAHPCQNCGLAKTNPVHRKKGGTCVFKRKIGCASCGKPKGHEDHMGGPPSLNILGSGNPQVYITLKKSWEALLTTRLERCGLPKGLESVSVEATAIFPDITQHRDEGNIRFLVEKALGDALQDGGWLEDDCFYPVRRYSFGALSGEHRPGVRGMILRITPGS